LTLSLKKRSGVSKELSIVTDGFSHTRPAAFVIQKDRLLIVNVKGIRLNDVGKEDLFDKVQKLCNGTGRVEKIVSCTRDLYENKPSAKEQGYFNSRPLIEWTTDKNVWYTFK
jgi:hypothetical protein